jgi:hypothetical protein
LLSYGSLTLAKGAGNAGLDRVLCTAAATLPAHDSLLKVRLTTEPTLTPRCPSAANAAAHHSTCVERNNVWHRASALGPSNVRHISCSFGPHFLAYTSWPFCCMRVLGAPST